MNYTNNIVQLTRQIEEARPDSVKHTTDIEVIDKEIEKIDEELLLLSHGVCINCNYTEEYIKLHLYSITSLMGLYGFLKHIETIV